jgi:predicted transcriptional regulator
MTTQIAVRLDDDLVAVMDEVVAADHITRAALVREGIVLACRRRNIERDPLVSLVASGRVTPARLSLAAFLARPRVAIAGKAVDSDPILDELRADR